MISDRRLLEILIISINFCNLEINNNVEGKAVKTACTILLLLMINTLVISLSEGK